MLINLINTMKLKGINQLQLAELLKVRPATISDKVNGKSKFSFEEAISIKKVFFPEYDLVFLFQQVEDVA